MSADKHKNVDSLYHLEGDVFLFEKPPSKEEARRQEREREEQKLARSEAKTNTTIAWLTGAVFFANLFTIYVGIWQAKISDSSAHAAIDAVAADWQVKMPLVVPYGIQPKWVNAPDGAPQIYMTQNIANTGESAAYNLHLEWGWGDHQLRDGEYQWKNSAWEGTTVAKGPGVYDSRKMSMEEAKEWAARDSWYECGHLTWEDRFPIRVNLGHATQNHSGKWCIRITNFHLTKDDTHWDANVTCTDSQCDQMQWHRPATGPISYPHVRQ